MGIKDIWTGFLGMINTEYDRRIRAASNVRAYQIGGHGHHDHHDDDHHDVPPEEQSGDPHMAFGTEIQPADVDPTVTPSSH